MKQVFLIGVLLLTAATTPPSGTRSIQEGTLINAGAPTRGEISRCFRGLDGPNRRFRMVCVLDAEGVPRQCAGEGLGEAEARVVNPRLNCIAEQYRWRRTDGGPTDGIAVSNTIEYRNWREGRP